MQTVITAIAHVSVMKVRRIHLGVLIPSSSERYSGRRSASFRRRRRLRSGCRVNAVCLVTPTGVGLAVDRLDVELLHQRADMFAANLMAFQFEHVTEHARSGEGVFQMQFIDAPQQLQIAL